jgi:hypothetical protein
VGERAVRVVVIVLDLGLVVDHIEERNHHILTTGVWTPVERALKHSAHSPEELKLRRIASSQLSHSLSGRCKIYLRIRGVVRLHLGELEEFTEVLDGVRQEVQSPSLDLR